MAITLNPAPTRGHASVPPSLHNATIPPPPGRPDHRRPIATYAIRRPHTVAHDVTLARAPGQQHRTATAQPTHHQVLASTGPGPVDGEMLIVAAFLLAGIGTLLGAARIGRSGPARRH